MSSVVSGDPENINSKSAPQIGSVWREGGREGEESERVENWRVADCPAMSFVFVC